MGIRYLILINDFVFITVSSKIAEKELTLWFILFCYFVCTMLNFSVHLLIYLYTDKIAIHKKLSSVKHLHKVVNW